MMQNSIKDQKYLNPLDSAHHHFNIEPSLCIPYFIYFPRVLELNKKKSNLKVLFSVTFASIIPWLCKKAKGKYFICIMYSAYIIIKKTSIRYKNKSASTVLMDWIMNWLIFLIDWLINFIDGLIFFLFFSNFFNFSIFFKKQDIF